jgi:hypothetical protein
LSSKQNERTEIAPAIERDSLYQKRKMRKLTLPDGRILYEDRGTGQPVILLHSGVADRPMYVDAPFRNRADVDPATRLAVAEMQSLAFSLPVPDNVSLRRLDPPAISRLDEIRVSVLIISGEVDVPEFSRFAEFLERRIAGAQRVVIPNSAHMATFDKHSF